MLIQHGADVNAKDDDGWTPLLQAALERHLEICKVLIQHGADVNAKNDNGWTALLVATFYGHLEICELLIEHGADVNAKDDIEQTPLHSAAYNGYLKICELLIEYGADVNAKDKYGDTPLHEAARYGYLESCELLIEQGADVHAKNWETTPQHYAANEGHLEICEVILIKHQAVIDIDLLSKYRKFKQSVLRYCFSYFKLKTDQALLDILTQKNATIRPFFLSLIQNEIPTLDRFIEEYACDSLFIYNRYRYIRFFLEHSLKFLTVRYSLNKQYMKRYRLWRKRFQFEYQHPIQADPLLVPTFSVRLTQNIKYCKTK